MVKAAVDIQGIDELQLHCEFIECVGSELAILAFILAYILAIFGAIAAV